MLNVAICGNIGQLAPHAIIPVACTGLSQLGNHAEVVMLDFAASLLAELEKWMSSASTAMVDLSSYADSDRFIGPASMVVDIQRRLYTDEARLSRWRGVLMGRGCLGQC